MEVYNEKNKIRYCSDNLSFNKRCLQCHTAGDEDKGGSVMAGTKKDPAKTYSSNYGGKREGAGRKKLETGRVCFQVSCQPSEEKIIREKAEKAGLSLSKYVVQCILNS